MARIYHDADADLGPIRARRIAVLGYGNQGHAHALNLRDSGCEVRVGLRPGGPSWTRARADGFLPEPVTDVSAWADVISLQLPDQFHKPVFDESIRPHLTEGKLLLVAHGFSILYGQIHPPTDIDVALVAPVGPGQMMRALYIDGLGEPALLALYQDVSGAVEELAVSYAAALGCTRAGVVRTTIREETEANLFGEQAVLCGGVSHLIRAGFDTLVEAGYQPEIAYFECVHTVKLIVDLIYEGGLAYMRSRISDTAEYGDYTSGPRVIDEHVKESMRRVLQDVQTGSFARSWVREFESGSPNLGETRLRERAALIEEVGARLRATMTWLDGAGEKQTEQIVLSAES
jgi:ketol-acid reductoisomerase